MNVNIKILKDGVKPEYKTEQASCLDCYAKKDIVIKANSIELIPLGFCLELPINYEAQIRPRSGLAKLGIQTILGTIDSDYRGEVNAIVMNNTSNYYKVKKGDRICQMFIGKTERIELVEKEELSSTVRGDGGFGSTGNK